MSFIRTSSSVNKALLGAAALATCIVAASPSQATRCDGLITDIRVLNDPTAGDFGAVHIEFGYGYIELCNLDQDLTYGGATYTPETCQRIYAQALTAMGTDNELRINFPGTSDLCTTILTNNSTPTVRGNWFYISQP
ncbi:hypothetical protein HFP51_02915 [Parasphingopyxis sp. CP4]|uniref:hypothetical protein n=1 Tax=Parasphingopyxis sp. CP4 TaxID=2724527 RepID=UPI0015A2DB9C|nr:hypothetical protein [Parasphingopyxis sp. CP4]QLC21229.1 hypothetical protein HFP51_02915 [Parasphingopyxis sp. CP4]